MDGIAHRVPFVVACSSLALLCGCRTVPVQEFEAYKRACSEARAAGEEVLLDYLVAKNESTRIQEAEGAGQERNRPEYLSFQVSTMTEAESLDSVGVRMHAWRVLGEYNEALTVVAQGHSRAEVTAAVDGLVGALQQFPIEEVSELAADAVPFSAAAKLMLEVLEREAAARHFADSMIAVRPTVSRFLDLLERDAQNFYNIRMGLRNWEYDTLTDRIADRVIAFRNLSKDFNIPPDVSEEDSRPQVYPLVDQINNILTSIPDWPQDGFLILAPGGDAAYTELAHSQFVEMAREIEQLAEQAQEVDERLVTYRNVLIQYVRMIQHTRRGLNGVTQALEQQRPPDAVAQDVFAAAVLLKRAFAEYEKAR